MNAALTAGGVAPMPHRFHDTAITLAALAVLLLWDFAGADLASMHLVGTADGFAWRSAFLTSTLAHEGGRVLGWMLLLALVVNVWRPLWPVPTRAERVRWLGVTVLCVLAVPALKQFSSTSCPWDLAEFGGMARHVGHWRFGLRDGGPGRCFPSGHATAAFAFFSGWFALRHHRPRAARLWLAAVLVVGLLFGGAQYLRGAHYPSHTLWTAWLCWTLCVLLAPPRPRLSPQRLADSGGATARV